MSSESPDPGPASRRPSLPRPLRQPRNVALLAILLAAGAFLVFRFGFSTVPVIGHAAVSGPLAAEVFGTGTLEARVSTSISPRLQERLAEVLVDQNDSVKAGQLLARLDDGELRRQVEVSEAGLSSARATAERVNVDESRADAVERQARLDHQRVADLAKTGVASQADLDKAIEQLRVAETDLRRARAATLEARQQVVMAEKSLAFHQERLGYARILSPYDGLVIRRDRDPGGVVVPGSSILQLISTNEVWVSAWVDETAATGLAPGQSARIVFRSAPGTTCAGEVARLGRETDRETREFTVDVRVKELPPNWTIGQRAEVFIRTSTKPNALTIPERFVQWRGSQAGVHVEQAGRARWRPITPGLRGGELVEVVKGLAAGDRVLLPAGPKPGSLVEGQRVSIP